MTSFGTHGTVATAPMTAFMTRAHRLLPPEEKTPLPPATKHPARRNALMIAAHVVFGAALGLLVERLEKADTPS